MLKRLSFFAMIIVLMFALMTTAFAQNPDWGTAITPIFKNAANEVTITEDLTGYTAPSDTGPYALGWAGNEKATYCNVDRYFDFHNWISVAQWMKVTVNNIDRIMLVRKPGKYTITNKPMAVRIASNGDVLVTFQEIWGSGGWDAAWYEFPGPGKTYPALANELVPQIPVDKKYMVTTYGEVDTVPPTDFVDIPAGDGVIKFLNSEALHNLNTPTNGFDMQFQEIVAPCNTTGDYVLRGRIIFQAFNQMWYIIPSTGQIDTGRSPSLVPPQPSPSSM